jgi:hypothetical protein
LLQGSDKALSLGVGILSWKVIVIRILEFEFVHAVPNYLYFGFFFAWVRSSWLWIAKCHIQGQKEVNADSYDYCSEEEKDN